MDETWLATAQRAAAAAQARRGPDQYRPHAGRQSDLNLHVGDMLAGPDVDADPARPPERTYE